MRYDAFRDAGGEQSASFALLDDYRSGVVFSAIAARDFARIYVKHITNGVADRDLSPEEAKVIELAVPKPLPPGEHGPKAQRAPLPETRRPAGLEPNAPNAPDGERPGAHEAPTAGGSPSSAATAAFEALGGAVGPADDEEAATEPSGDDFTWEPPPERPSGAPSRR